MGKRERGGRWVENPEDIGEVSDLNLVRLPEPSLLFATRAERLRAVAEGNALGDYLRFLAVLGSAQHDAATAMPVSPARTRDRWRRASARACRRSPQTYSKASRTSMAPYSCGFSIMWTFRTRRRRRGRHGGARWP